MEHPHLKGYGGLAADTGRDKEKMHMANEEQLAILRQGVAVWNQWRKDYPQMQVNLNGASLSGLDPSEANFSGESLVKAVLSHCILNGVKMKAILH